MDISTRDTANNERVNHSKTQKAGNATFKTKESGIHYLSRETTRSFHPKTKIGQWVKHTKSILYGLEPQTNTIWRPIRVGNVLKLSHRTKKQNYLVLKYHMGA